MDVVSRDSRRSLTVVFSAGFLGGSELFNLEFLREALTDGAELHAIVPSHGALSEALQDVASSVTVVETPRSIRSLSRFDGTARVLSSLPRLRDALAYMKGLRDVLSRTDGPICCFGFRAQLALGLQPSLGRPIGWVVHEIVPPGPYAKVWHVAARRAHSVWAYSSAAADQPALRGTRVHLCVVRLALESFTALQYPQWPPHTVGLIGDLFPIKNHFGLIDVVERLRGRGIPADGLLVGRPAANSPAHVRYGEALVEAVEQTDSHVRLTQAEPAAMHQKLAEIDTLLHLTTVPETFGRVCVEALASARPVVAFNHGAVADVVPDMGGGSGALCPPGDLGAVADSVARLWASRATYLRACSSARAHALANYGPDQRGETIGDALGRFMRTA